MFLFKNNELIWVTAVTTALHGTIAFTYMNEQEIPPASWLELIAVWSPFTITLAMIYFPKRFGEQLYRWIMGLCASALFSGVFILAIMVSETGVTPSGVLMSLLIGSIAGPFGGVIFSGIAFLLGGFINLFQKKPTPHENISHVFE